MYRGLTRRDFLKWAGAAGAGCLLPGARAADDLLRVSVLHTTDLHGHILPAATYEGEVNVGGFARCAAQINSWKTENPHWLLLDAGDVFQGTDVGWRTRGEVMTRCFNLLGYDAWAIGNHEFDWGIEPLARCLQSFGMPALSANAARSGPAAELANIRPWLLKEVAGVRIGVIGLTTTGLPYWFLPDFTAGFVAGDPVPAARRAADELVAQSADALVLIAHMGTRPAGDDFANRIEAVAEAVPELDLIIAGHTHRDIPSQRVRGIPYTQASYFGIHAGRASLLFDRSSRKLVGVETSTVRMGPDKPADPAVLSLCAADLEASTAALAAPAGTVAETLSATAPLGVPSEVERLIAASITAALPQHGIAAVFHGTFSRDPIPPGLLTVAGVWKLLPYENQVVVGALDAEALEAVMQESLAGPRSGVRSLCGLRVQIDRSATPPRVTVTAGDKPLERGRRYKIAMNTYDAAGGGQRLLRLREVMASPEARANVLPVQTREALINFLAAHGARGVSKADLPPA